MSTMSRKILPLLSSMNRRWLVPPAPTVKLSSRTVPSASVNAPQRWSGVPSM